MTYYDIHGLIRVDTENLTADVQRDIELHLGHFRQPHLSSPPDLVIRPYRSAPPLTATSWVEGIGIRGTTVDIPRERFRCQLVHFPLEVYADHLALPTNLIVELALLKRGASFVHGAGINVLNQAILFPAFGGIGKTTVTVDALERGADTYGDDLCILKEGSIFPYTQQVALSDDLMALSGFKTREASWIMRRNQMIEMSRSITAHRDGIVLRAIDRVLLHFLAAPPHVTFDEIFGRKTTASAQPLTQIFYLERDQEARTIVSDDIDVEWLVNRCAPTLWLEWHSAAKLLLQCDALTGGQITGAQQVAATLLRRTFTSAQKTQLIRIPMSCPPVEVQRGVWKIVAGDH